MSWLMDLADRLRAVFRLRRITKAQADLQRGADILTQAQREAAEMESARRELDAQLPPVPATPAPVPGSVAAAPDAETTRITKP